MQVIVNQSHTENTGYLNPHSCPLFKAIKEQYPDFPLEGVGGQGTLKVAGSYKSHKFYPAHQDRILDENGEWDMTKSWSYATYNLLRQGDIESVTVQIVEI